MWLFSQRGFFSITSVDKNTLLVRARVQGDIEKYWPNAKVQRTPDRDYLYRAEIPRKEVADVVLKIVEDINYGNFKNSIYDRHRRSPFYSDVWETMFMLQLQAERSYAKSSKSRRGSDENETP